MAIRFEETDVRGMGRTAYGVRGITLRDDDFVVAMEIIRPGGTMLTVTERGFGKRTEIDEYRVRLRDAGIECTDVANHDDSEWGLADDLHPGVFVRSIYFQDPDGILLEFACWTRDLGPGDVSHEPARAVDAATA